MRDLIGRLSRLDRAALALVGAWIVWAVTTSLLHGRFLSPLSPYVVAPVMIVIGIAVGRQLSDRFAHEWSEDPRPAGLAIAAVTAFFVWQLWRGGAGGGPLGYANANSALAVQGLGLLALATINSRPRRYFVLALVGMVATAAVIGSRAGLAVALPVLAVVALVLLVQLQGRGWIAAGVLVCAVSVAASLVGVMWLARASAWPDLAAVAFDEARRQLWGDAWALWQQHPVIGAGPGAFQRFSALAADPDTDTAHSSVLQIAAETGVVGVVLFACLVVLGFVIAAQGPARAALIGVAAWSGLAIHSAVDHLLEFPLIVLAAGLVLGWAGSRRSGPPGDGGPQPL